MKNKNYKNLVLHFIFSLALLFSPLFLRSAIACSCLSLPSIYESFEKSDAVFTGKILSFRDVKSNSDYLERIYRFQVNQNFKGATNSEIDVSVGEIDSSCFQELEVGNSYLIYGFNYKDKILISLPCSRSTKFANAEDQIYFGNNIVDSSQSQV